MMTPPNPLPSKEKEQAIATHLDCGQSSLQLMQTILFQEIADTVNLYGGEQYQIEGTWNQAAIGGTYHGSEHWAQPGDGRLGQSDLIKATPDS